ncbi:MAG: BLUF domain-containing protein [Chloroflexota bacterium]
MSNLISIVYASSAVTLFSEQQLIDLLKKSHTNNAKQDITGMLLYKGGNFIQALEGPEANVIKLYEKIAQDPRHDDIMLLNRQAITGRQFSEWEMGFGNLSQSTEEAVIGFTRFLDKDFDPQYFRDNPLRAYIMLLNFKTYM